MLCCPLETTIQRKWVSKATMPPWRPTLHLQRIHPFMPTGGHATRTSSSPSSMGLSHQWHSSPLRRTGAFRYLTYMELNSSFTVRLSKAESNSAYPFCPHQSHFQRHFPRTPSS